MDPDRSFLFQFIVIINQSNRKKGNSNHLIYEFNNLILKYII